MHCPCCTSSIVDGGTSNTLFLRPAPIRPCLQTIQEPLSQTLLPLNPATDPGALPEVAIVTADEPYELTFQRNSKRFKKADKDSIPHAPCAEAVNGVQDDRDSAFLPDRNQGKGTTKGTRKGAPGDGYKVPFTAYIPSVSIFSEGGPPSLLYCIGIK